MTSADAVAEPPPAKKRSPLKRLSKATKRAVGIKSKKDKAAAAAAATRSGPVRSFRGVSSARRFAFSPR
jgi:hypothetical protein